MCVHVDEATFERGPKAIRLLAYVLLSLANRHSLFYYEYMISLSIRPQKIQILQTKKAILGSNSSIWMEKSFEKKLIEKGSFALPELLTSAIKETLSTSGKDIRDKEVVVSLHHSVYTLFRTEIPLEIDKTAYHVYLKEQFSAANDHMKLNDYVLEMFVKEYENRKYGFVYALSKEELAKVAQALELLDFKLTHIVPEQLAYYTVFDKTLRLDKHEHILFVTYEDQTLEGFYYDTFGPLPEPKAWIVRDVTSTNIESTLSQKASEYAAKVAKLNRLVISGADSDKIRQDTFTKNVGVWTNPMKRIVPNFYQEYVTLIQGKAESGVTFPALAYSDVFGTFICMHDTKAFVYSRSGAKNHVIPPITHSSSPAMSTHEESKRFRFPKEIMLFVVIFLITFGLFYFIANSRSSEGFSFFGSPSPTPTAVPTEAPPSPTPTIEVKREEIRVQVLNGTGVAGQAGSTKTLLTTAGYKDVTTGNASKYDYTQSEVQIKKDKEYVKDTILEDIKTVIESPKVTELDSTSTSDVVIIIGKDVR